MPRTRRKAQPIQVPTNQPYGVGTKMAEAQRQMPLSGPTPVPSTTQSAGPSAPTDPIAAALAAAAQMDPPVEGGLTRPTERPGEPVTTGLAIGPGAGPEAMGLPALPETDPVLADLILAYQMHPSRALAQLIELTRARGAARQRTLDAGRQAAASARGRFL